MVKMRIGFPIDSQNYEKRLNYLENGGASHVDVITWPPRDFDSFRKLGNTRENTRLYREFTRNLGERLKGMSHIGSVSFQLPYFLTASPETDWTFLRRSFPSSYREIRETIISSGLMLLLD